MALRRLLSRSCFCWRSLLALALPILLDTLLNMLSISPCLANTSTGPLHNWVSSNIRAMILLILSPIPFFSSNWSLNFHPGGYLWCSSSVAKWISWIMWSDKIVPWTPACMILGLIESNTWILSYLLCTLLLESWVLLVSMSKVLCSPSNLICILPTSLVHCRAQRVLWELSCSFCVSLCNYLDQSNLTNHLLNWDRHQSHLPWCCSSLKKWIRSSWHPQRTLSLHSSSFAGAYMHITSYLCIEPRDLNQNDSSLKINP